MPKPKTPETFLYTLATGAESYIITKWDSIGFEQLSQYIMPFGFDDGGDRQVGCTCPQGLKPSCRHRKMLPRVIHILDIPGAFYRYGDDRFLGVFDGKLRPLTEQEEFAIMGREQHPLSAEQYDEDEIAQMPDGLERDELVGEAVEPSGSDPIADADSDDLITKHQRPVIAPISRINRRGF